MSLEALLPNGLPVEFSLISIFRMHGRTIKNTWNMLHISKSPRTTIFSLSFNGINRSIVVSRFSVASPAMIQTVAISGPLVATLFDRSFHKLELLVEQSKITIMIDCQQVPSVMKFNPATPDFAGTTISVMSSGKSTSAVDIQDLTLKCGDDDAEECCELPGRQCSRNQADTISTPISDTCGCMPERKSAQVRTAERAEITKLATKIANRLVESKINELMVLLDLNPGAIGNRNITVLALNRRAAVRSSSPPSSQRNV
uniref:Thrombospondin-like N-terminal domain-containing protein n=1 Tax=Ciona savignyi TaxID=51511 RepID=H2Y5L7_CIOSA